MIRLLIIVAFIASLPCPAAGQDRAPSKDAITPEMLWATMNERHGNYLERFDSIQSNVTTAKQELQERLASVNEFRGQLRDQATLLMPRAEADARIKSLEERINALSVTVISNTAKAEGAGSTWGVLIALAGIAIAVIAVGVNIRNSNRGTRR